LCTRQRKIQITKKIRKKALVIHKSEFVYDETDLNNRGKNEWVAIVCLILGNFKQTPKVIYVAVKNVEKKSKENQRNISENNLLNKVINGTK